MILLSRMNSVRIELLIINYKEAKNIEIFSLTDDKTLEDSRENRHFLIV